MGQGRFKSAAAARDAGQLIRRLETIGVDEERVEELAGLVRRTGSLILQRPDTKAQAERDAFLSSLRECLVALAPDIDLTPFDVSAASVRNAEDGHLRILAALDRCEISRRELPVRLSAAFLAAEHRLAEVNTMIETALMNGAQFSVPGGVPLTDEDGQPRSADALLTAIVEGLSGLLKMEAYKSGLFAKAGWMELPSLTAASVEDRGLYFLCEALGVFWQRWERLHQKAHYGDQVIDILSGSRLPPNCPPEVTQVFTRQADVNFVDWAANERALDREGLSHRNLVTTTNVEAIAKGISGPVAALPTEWISGAEVAQSLSLSEAVGFEIIQDTTLYAGLKLTQWVRGYMALVAWAEARTPNSAGTLRTSRKELVDLLVRLSFSPPDAEVFLDAVCFGRTSRDLWDAPIVRTKTDWLVVGAAVSAQRLAKIIPSLLASKDVQIKRKGFAFEARVLEFLTDKGLEARAVTINRGGAEYQYDVLVRWGDKILLIECKNHGLSGNDPVQAHHFLQGLQEDLDQVNRLVRGIDEWPEVVIDAFGPDAAALDLIPILLQNETFSAPGPIDGVYVYDWSALTRFFEAGWLRFSHDHQIAEGQTFRNRVAVKKIWSGDTPTANDLIAEMAHPHQLKVLDELSEVVQSVFQLDEQTLACDWSIIRYPPTIERIAAACGVAPEPIAARLKEIDDAFLAAKARAFRPTGSKLGKRARRRRGKDSR